MTSGDGVVCLILNLLFLQGLLLKASWNSSQVARPACLPIMAMEIIEMIFTHELRAVTARRLGGKDTFL